MATEEISTLCPKLGITSPRVIRKAKEFSQLLDVRSNSGSFAALKLTGACKTVACIALAADFLSHTLDKSVAVRVSGSTKQNYLMCVKTIESLLDLKKITTIREMAVQLGCSTAVPMAQTVLQKYIDSQCGEDMDFQTSLFQAAALCAVCKKQKVKIDRSKLKEMCAVKKSCFDTLVADMEKLADTLQEDKKPQSNKRTSSLMEAVDRHLKDLPDKKRRESLDNEDADVQTTDYEAWKKRILENAARKNQDTS